jgi:hypothetical protein
MKFYTSNISVKIHNENQVSSDVRKCFMTKSGDKQNHAAVNLRMAFEKDLALVPIEGSLRIHIEFPGVQGGTPKSCVQGNDILVYIDCKNMDLFFNPENKKMDDVKRIIRYVGKY